MKKIILAAVAVLALSDVLGALTLPDGKKVAVTSYNEVNGVITDAVLAANTPFVTKSGIFYAAQGTVLSFYESGALKSLFTNSDSIVKLSSGKYTVTSKVITSPTRQEIPVVFYESGNIKSAYLPYRNAKKDGFVSNQAKTPLGTIICKQMKTISFFDDGSVESLYLPADQEAEVLGKKITLSKNSKVKFHENGTLKSFMPLSFDVSGIAAKEKTYVTVSDSGKVTEFTPGIGQYKEINGLSYMYSNNEPVEYYDDGNIKSFCLDCASNEIEISGIKMQKAEGITLTVQFTYFNSGSIESVSAVSFTATNAAATKMKPFLILPDGNKVLGNDFLIVQNARYYENGNYKDALLVAEKKFASETPNTSTGFSRLFFDDKGKLAAVVGWEHYTSPKGEFYDKNLPSIFITTETKIIKTIHDDRITDDSEILFDENFKPVKYTAHGKIGSADADNFIEKMID